MRCTGCVYQGGHEVKKGEYRGGGGGLEGGGNDEESVLKIGKRKRKGRTKEPSSTLNRNQAPSQSQL